MTYREAQIEAHQAKALLVWGYDYNAQYILHHVATMGFATDQVICHGVRNGSEIERFCNAGAKEVRGTEIADVDIPGVVTADYHDHIPEFVGWADIVYSNSHDHSDRPAIFLKRCREQIRGSGLLILEHSDGHEKQSDIEPWSVDLHSLISEVTSNGFELVGVLNMPLKHLSYSYQVAVIFMVAQ